MTFLTALKNKMGFSIVNKLMYLIENFESFIVCFQFNSNTIFYRSLRRRNITFLYVINLV